MRRKPVMVFAGEFWAGASGAGLSEGFRDIGWAVQEVDYRHYGARPGRNFALRIASRLTREIADDVYQKTIIEECQTLKPDVFLTIKGTGITRKTLQEIRGIGAKTVMYYPDFHFAHRGLSIDSFGEYDLFVTTKTFQIEYLVSLLGRDRVEYVPHGFSGRIHRPLYDSVQEGKFTTDVLYVGSHSAYKQRWIESAVSTSPDLTFQLIGNGWKRALAGEQLNRCTAAGERTGASYAAAIQSAKINIAIHFGPTTAGWEDVISTRTFEIPACRGFMLHIDSSEVREFFKPGVEIDVFSSPEELRDKIQFYVTKPDLRAKMVERAYARCVPAYSYLARAKKISEFLKLPTSTPTPRCRAEKT